MQWHYERNGQPLGPVAEEELNRLAQTGEVTTTTRVWREGLAGWVPYGTRNSGAVPPPMPAGSRCARCGQAFPEDEMVELFGHKICAACKPLYLQGLREGAPAALMTGARVWRSGKQLVMDLESPLPPRCVKCNEPVTAADFRRKLYWHTPWLFLLVLISVLVYAIAALIVRKRATIHIGLCERHRRKRRTFVWVAWGLVFAGIGMIVAGAVGKDLVVLIILGIVAILAGAVVGTAGARVVSAKRITKERIWLVGVHESFLATLPPWDGPDK
ncbi:MAG: DUF4339 domain-containing protein [Verrucomicrobia bacterium]|nr:DUF4339 domain-containing protein [Verrucomicrobiota bacterium]